MTPEERQRLLQRLEREERQRREDAWAELIERLVAEDEAAKAPKATDKWTWMSQRYKKRADTLNQKPRVC